MRLYRSFLVDQVVTLILPMFFALSGFLVAGSLERCRTLVGFLSMRALRILPALAMEIVLSALVLGPLVTDLPTAAYFGDPEFARYFLNIIGDIHYHLPGVFVTNPLASVNQQLWTIPFELECYVALAVLASLGLHRQRQTFVAVVTSQASPCFRGTAWRSARCGCAAMSRASRARSIRAFCRASAAFAPGRQKTPEMRRAYVTCPRVAREDR
jgi:peptidoglycan/LPS O-acetylase OafA/YrhL